MLCLKHIRMAKKPIFECFTDKFKRLQRTNKKITVKLVAD